MSGSDYGIRPSAVSIGRFSEGPGRRHRRASARLPLNLNGTLQSSLTGMPVSPPMSRVSSNDMGFGNDLLKCFSPTLLPSTTSVAMPPLLMPPPS